MASEARHDDDAMISGINVTPLVDITIVLLVIFMVTARLIDHHAMDATLPESARSDVVQEDFSVELHADGTALLRGKKLGSDEDVLEIARAARAKDPKIHAVIRADASVPHGRVIHVLDLLKRADVNRVAFGVQPVPEPR